MYHVIIIGITAFILYLLTLAASSFGIIKKKDHRALWNTLLLITFFFTAIAGLFLALQSNYKWEVRSVEKILNWHVDFGIAMSFTAIIHLTWHLGYYNKILIRRDKNIDDSPVKDETREGSPPDYRLMLIILGFISGSMQVIFLREILNLAGGYELAAGAVFAFWIFLSATGAKLAGRSSRTKIFPLTAGLPLAGIISLLIYIALSRILLKEGITPGIVYTLIITGLSLLPFCFLSGFLFVALSYRGHSEKQIAPGKSFALETIGSMIAGIIITVVTGKIMGNFQIMAAALIVYYITFLVSVKCHYFKLLTVAGIILLVLLFIFKPDTLIRNILLVSVDVKESIDSKYGNIAIGEYEGERSVFYNHRLIDYEQDERQREEDIHYAMIQHPLPEDVLIISGGADKHIQEVLKYPSVKSVTYLERDPVIIACTRDTSIDYSGTRVVFENDDAFSFIRRVEDKYDVIISLMAEPDNIVTNRFFTEEYFRDIRSILNEGGIFMLKAGSAGSYLSEEQSSTLSIIYKSLKGIFPDILPVKGESLYLISSERVLDPAIPELIEERGIENIYVNPYYLNTQIMRYNSEQVFSLIDTTMAANRLDKPVAVFFKQKHELRKAGSGRITLIVFICLLLFLPYLTGSGSSRTMYSTSLNLAGTEILALILINSTTGNFYQLAGLLIAITMAGLAAGSSARFRTGDRLTDIIPVILGVIAILYALLSTVILKMQTGTLPALLALILVIIPAVLAGYYYRMKTEDITGPGNISGIYFADMCGSALGFLIIAGILVPLYGIRSAFFILAFLNFASYITNFVIRGVGKLTDQ